MLTNRYLCQGDDLLSQVKQRFYTCPACYEFERRVAEMDEQEDVEMEDGWKVVGCGGN